MISDNFYKVGEITNLLRKSQKQSNNNKVWFRQSGVFFHDFNCLVNKQIEKFNESIK